MRRNTCVAVCCGLVCVAASLAVAAEEPRLSYEVIVRAKDDPDLFGHIYLCGSCDPTTWETIVLPDGATRTDLRLRLQAVDVTPLTPPSGVPATLDLSPTIPGAEMIYMMRVLSVRPVGYRFSSGIQFRARVERTNTFRYEAGSVVHELTDGEGDRWILFSLRLDQSIHDPAGEGTLDHEVPDGLSDIKGPWFWSYSSRVLEEDLLVSSHGVTEIIGQSRGGGWQRIGDHESAATSLPIEEVLRSSGP